jgi:hypothetical protein
MSDGSLFVLGSVHILCRDRVFQFRQVESMFPCIALVHEDSSCARVDKRLGFDQFIFLRGHNVCVDVKRIIIGPMY